MTRRKKLNQYRENRSIDIISDYLNILPREYAKLAISQSNYDLLNDGMCLNLERAINLFSFWDVTDEGVEFWYAVADAVDGDEVDVSKLPVIPKRL